MSSSFFPSTASPPGFPDNVRIVTLHVGSIFGTVSRPGGGHD